MTLSPRTRKLPQSHRSRNTHKRRMGSEALSNGHRPLSRNGNGLLRNESKGGWVVQKYGGTSVGKFASNIAEDIIRYVEWLDSIDEEDLEGMKS